MIVVNETPLPVAAVPNADDEDTMLVLFLVGLTCRIHRGELLLSPEQRPLIMSSQEEMVPEDAHFYREGVSVTASGFVYMPGGRGHTTTASLAVNGTTRRVQAFGPRVWQKGLTGNLVPSAPVPVDRVEMTWHNTYGGIFEEPARLIEYNGEQAIVPPSINGFPLNLRGKGFFIDPARAIDQPLPQLEDPDRLVKGLDDRPEPVCFAPYPLDGALRAASLLNADRQVDLSRVPRLTARACPRMLFDQIKPSTPIRLEGMRPNDEPLEFAVPESPASVDATVGRLSYSLDLDLDAIEIDAESSLVRFVFRRIFRYPLVQFEERQAFVRVTDTLLGLSTAQA